MGAPCSRQSLGGQARDQEALAAYEKGVELDPTNVRGLLLLAGMNGRLWQTDKALAAYNRILQIDPNHDQAFGLLVNEVLSLGDWTVHRAFVTTILGKITATDPDPQFDNVSIFNLQALPIPYEFIAEAARRRSTRLLESLRDSRKACTFADNRTSHYRPPEGTKLLAGDRSKDRLTIGFVLPYTYRHSLPDALKPVIEQFDRGRFEIVGFSCRADDGSKFSRDYRATFDRFTELSPGNCTSPLSRLFDHYRK